MEEKTCVICGKKFIPKIKTQVRCGAVHIKKCVMCGKEFEIGKYEKDKEVCSRECWNGRGKGVGIIKKHRTCGTKVKRCVICGAEFTVGSASIRKTCSKKCRMELYHQTCRANIGYDHPAESPEILARASEKRATTFQDRYGHEYPLQVPEFLDRAKATFTEHYGVDNPMKSSEIVQKAIETCEAKYGVKRPSQAEQFKRSAGKSGRKSRATVKKSD